MPKIRINEIDNTGLVQASSVSNTVFVPIISNTPFAPTLFTSAAAFKDAGKSIPDSSSTATLFNTENLDAKICIHLLNIGFYVIVQGVRSAANIDWDGLADKGLYDIRFLTNGTMTGAIPSAMVICAKNRGDCVALVNLDETAIADGATDFNYDIQNIRTGFSGISNGEYAAGFTPWFFTTNSDLSANDQPVKIPAAFGYLFAYANAIKNNPEWYAIAGFERGIIPELTGVAHEYSSADIEVLQARGEDREVELDAAEDNVGVAINPIANIRPAGHIIYGNRTLRVNDASKKLIATSFLNVRNGISAIKKLMYEASRKYMFEQNTEVLWINFQSYITPLLDRMQAGNGILGYRFIKQKTNAKARLKARLNIVPVEAVEDFDLEVFLTDDLTVSE